MHYIMKSVGCFPGFPIPSTFTIGSVNKSEKIPFNHQPRLYYISNPSLENMSLVTLTVVLWLLLIALIPSTELCNYEDVGLHIKALGWTSVNAVYCNRNEREKLNGIIKVISAFGVRTAAFHLHEFGVDAILRKKHPSLVFLCEEDEAAFAVLQSFLGCKLPAYRALFISTKRSVGGEGPPGIERANYSVGFYQLLAPANDDRCRLYRVQTFREEAQPAVRNPLNVNRFGIIEEKYDLKGSRLVFQTLPWPPWLDFVNCSNSREPRICDAVGILPEIVDLLGKMFNFRPVYKRHPVDEWGGDFDGDFLDVNFVFSDGAFGQMAAGKFDSVLSVWDASYYRNGWSDTTISICGRPMAVVGDFSNAQMLDFALFLKPFTPQCWSLILPLAVFIFLFSSQWRRAKKEFEWRRLLMFSLSAFYVVLYAFYGGALTMFFTSKAKIPFETVEDAALKYPQWKIIMTEVAMNFFPGFTPQLIDYKRMMEEEEMILSSAEEVVELMAEERNLVTYESLDVISAAYYALNEEKRPKYVGHLEPNLRKEAAVIFTKSSPATKMFNAGLLRLIESGFIDSQLKHHIKYVPKASDLGKEDNSAMSMTVLELRHVGLAFIAYGFAMFFCAAILAGEIAMKVYNKMNVTRLG